MSTTVTIGDPRTNQCKRPTGLIGRLILRNMNARHSKVTDWGLSQISFAGLGAVLDVGCGGGKTLSKLAALVPTGMLYGVDHSSESVKVAKKLNRLEIQQGRIEIREASVSELPFPENTFDLVTAIESHFWWPNLVSDLGQVLRVLKTGCTFLIIAEVYRGAKTKTAELAEKYLPRSGMALLTPEEHKELLAKAGFSDVQVNTEPSKGWICCIARKATH